MYALFLDQTVSPSKPTQKRMVDSHQIVTTPVNNHFASRLFHNPTHRPFLLPLTPVPPSMATLPTLQYSPLVEPPGLSIWYRLENKAHSGLPVLSVDGRHEAQAKPSRLARFMTSIVSSFTPDSSRNPILVRITSRGAGKWIRLRDLLIWKGSSHARERGQMIVGNKAMIMESRHDAKYAREDWIAVAKRPEWCSKSEGDGLAHSRRG